MHYQIKDPKVENAESIQKFFDKKDLSDKKTFVLTPEGYKQTIRKIGFPGIQIFDHKGKYISYSDDESCTGNVGEFFGTLQKSPEFNVSFPDSDTLRLNHVLKELRNLDGEAVVIDEFDEMQSDFVVIIYWAKFVGRLNSRDSKSWLEGIDKNTDSTFETIWVNSDLQDWWDEADLKQFGFSQ